MPNIPEDQSACQGDGAMDYEIDVGVQFDANQTGCENEQSYAVPRGLACVRLLQKVVSGCEYLFLPLRLENSESIDGLGRSSRWAGLWGKGRG